MIFLSLHNNVININKLEQRLVQIFAYFIGTQFLHELMYLGMDYAFKFSSALNLENIKGNFYMSNLLYTRNLFNLRSLFRPILKSAYTPIIYNSFGLFKKFHTIIHTINPVLNILDFIIQIGARSNIIQYQQITGMRGFLRTSRGYLTTIPLLHNFERGLDLTEYIVSAYGVRKGLLDTSLQTSESGYLTRRLVEVIQDIIIKEHYCGSDSFLILRKYNTIQGYIQFPDRQLLFNKYFYNTLCKMEFHLKSPLLCYSGRSVCTSCSGFGGKLKVLGGESVGVIFGELLGEPSTQLTLRTFHTGGILRIAEENNYYNIKQTVNYQSCLLNTKNILFKTKKNNCYKLKFNIVNKFKFMPFQKLDMINICLNKNLSRNLLRLSLHSLIIYKLNLLPLYPILRCYSRNTLTSCRTFIHNIFLNICSTHLLLQNKLSEWAIILLRDNLNSCIVNYIPEKFMGGISLTKYNYGKFYSIFNTSLLY